LSGVCRCQGTSRLERGRVSGSAIRQHFVNVSLSTYLVTSARYFIPLRRAYHYLSLPALRPCTSERAGSVGATSAAAGTGLAPSQPCGVCKSLMRGEVGQLGLLPLEFLSQRLAPGGALIVCAVGFVAEVSQTPGPLGEVRGAPLRKPCRSSSQHVHARLCRGERACALLAQNLESLVQVHHGAVYDLLFASGSLTGTARVGILEQTQPTRRRATDKILSEEVKVPRACKKGLLPQQKHSCSWEPWV
jgi:hypothetical protein